ncbi:hypothetical protein ACYB2S_13715 [Corynebacterium variabile]|uniref:hypothetical protein n=1 Tax=Corynebacterium variabile TaxID=1727 RepID=UPI003CBA28FD
MTLKRFALYGAATLTALTLTSCGEESNDESVLSTKADASEAPAPDIAELTHDCATSNAARKPSGGGAWAPTEQWTVEQDGKTAVATAWYEINGISEKLSVTCNADYVGNEWTVTAVGFVQPTIHKGDLTAEQSKALRAAYGSDFDPNSIYHLQEVCSRDIYPDSVTAQELSGAKIMCPLSILEDNSSTETTPTPSDPVRSSFRDGTHAVGTDIQPGTYRSSGSDMCYWERLSGFGGQLEDIIANGNPSGQAIVTIAPTDVAFKSQRCGTWEMVQ